ncbi:hypothetical protein [Sulfuricurvum sp.]|uniref:hypothetical protein n=1 Tax=Sulfuricurvum sp. TaxID=2025608 RepID=UPI003567790D
MALTAYSGYSQGRAQRAEGIAQGNYYDYIARQNEQEAEQAIKSGDLQARMIQDEAKETGKQLKKEQAQLSASQISQMVAQGMDISSVSSQDIVASTKDTQRLDELSVRYNADVKTWGVQTDAKYKNWALKSQAEQARYAGANARKAGKMNATATYLKTGASLLGSAMTFGNAGVFSKVSSGNVPGTGIFGTKLFGSTQSQILGQSTKAFI